MLRAVVTAGVFVGLLSAGAHAAGPFRAGVELGFSRHDQSWNYSGERFFEPEDGVDSVTGGVFAELGVSRTVAARSGVCYNRRGFTDKIEVRDEFGNSEATKWTYRGNYVSVPFLVTARFPQNGTTLFMTAGPSLEFLASEDESLPTLLDVEVVSPLGNLFNAVLLGGSVAVGAEWNRIGVAVRYYRDLTRSVDPPARATLDDVVNSGVAIVASAVLFGS